MLNISKHDCHTCIYKRELSYTHHIECDMVKDLSIPAKILLSSNVPSLKVELKDENGEVIHTETCVDVNEHGRKNGWADWPIQFDPIWIDKCVFFKT